MTTLISRSSLLHLRIPFSIFLFPVYLFALAISPNFNPERILIVFICLHFLLYPATNGFNSYYDKDEESIGGLKHPPKVTDNLLYISLLLDFAAILLALKISLLFAAFIFIYGIISKAYSHPVVRLKKYPWLSWITAGFFQGAFTFWACYIGINDFSLSTISHFPIFGAGLLTTLLLLANYPLTQIYQHNEDARRGDLTLSRQLGIKGTFTFAAALFIVAAILFVIYFISYYQDKYAWYFIAAFSFPALFFIYWIYSYSKDADAVNYSNTMRLSYISALSMNIFFIYLFLDLTQVLQTLRGGF
jgi:1,4-dihydroxy-2-naphthoate octaprenyltransferase